MNGLRLLDAFREGAAAFGRRDPVNPYRTSTDPRTAVSAEEHQMARQWMRGYAQAFEQVNGYPFGTTPPRGRST